MWIKGSAIKAIKYEMNVLFCKGKGKENNKKIRKTRKEREDNDD